MIWHVDTFFLDAKMQWISYSYCWYVVTAYKGEHAWFLPVYMLSMLQLW